jgi:hypothetical protein
VEEIARELKVSPGLLSRWRALPGFQEALEETCKDRIMEEMPRLLQALTEKAKEGNVQAIKILFDYMGQLRGRSGTDIEDLTEEERKEFKLKALQRIDDLRGRIEKLRISSGPPGGEG